ncbi:hypothetical protein DFH07DRAFT_766083 [Mycena maculata]|uniref:Uncharacterized protein n=1 Tax=Mycena maculata TaxID=230809 RepID=A0AAD7K5V4_9AGAR|nr:hypothetical protein DFH07DRAFT_766083 [Mycena maculata]
MPPPSRSSSPTSPPSSPRPLDDLLALAQQLTPRKSPRTLRKIQIRDQIQVQANDAQQERTKLKRLAIDAEQQADTARKPAKRRKRGDRAQDADESEPNAKKLETVIRDAGRNFTITRSLFLIDHAVFTTEPDFNFNYDHEFDSTENELKGQLCDILAVLPESVRPKINQQWVQDSFLDGLHAQRASIGHRLCVEALPYIADNVKAFNTSASRFEAFSELIGYKKATPTTAKYYDRFEAPILYDEWNGTTYVSLIRGKKGAVGLFEGLSRLPQAACLERIHHIVAVGPGGISIAAILTIWLHSADTQLVQVGDETSIDYGKRLRAYNRRIREGLRDKKAWAIDLLKYWNQTLFPNADQSDYGAAGLEDLDDDADLDDIFSQAPSVPDSAVPSINASSHDNDEEEEEQPRWTRHTSSPTPPSPQHSRQSSKQPPARNQHKPTAQASQHTPNNDPPANAARRQNAGGSSSSRRPLARR